MNSCKSICNDPYTVQNHTGEFRGCRECVVGRLSSCNCIVSCEDEKCPNNDTSDISNKIIKLKDTVLLCRIKCLQGKLK